MQATLYEVPQGVFDEELVTDVDLEIRDDGTLIFQGDTLDPYEIEPLNAYLRSEGRDKIGIKPAGEARFDAVVANLAPIGRYQSYELIGLEVFRKFERATDFEGEELGARGFQGEVGEVELPILIGYAANSDRCVVMLSQQVLGSDELYERSFDWLDTIVVRAGGPEVLLSTPGALEELIARVQSVPGTPWRCIGGAMYSIHAAGWPYIRLEVVDPTAT